MCVQSIRPTTGLRKRNVLVNLDGALISVNFESQQKLKAKAISAGLPVVAELPYENYMVIQQTIYSKADGLEWKNILTDILGHDCLEDALLKSFDFIVGKRALNAVTKYLGFDPTLKEACNLVSMVSVPYLGSKGLASLNRLFWDLGII